MLIVLRFWMRSEHTHSVRPAPAAELPAQQATP
jgi:hypothetical protein